MNLHGHASGPPQDELTALRERVEELEGLVHAIRTGEVDALVTTGDGGDRVFTLRSADQPTGSWWRR